MGFKTAPRQRPPADPLAQIVSASIYNQTPFLAQAMANANRFAQYNDQTNAYSNWIGRQDGHSLRCATNLTVYRPRRHASVTDGAPQLAWSRPLLNRTSVIAKMGFGGKMRAFENKGPEYALG